MARDTETHYYSLPRVEMALVSHEGIWCARCNHHHFIPPGDTLTVDLNGAKRLCPALAQAVRLELRRRLWLRIIRQFGTPEPYEYLSTGDYFGETRDVLQSQADSADGAVLTPDLLDRTKQMLHSPKEVIL